MDREELIKKVMEAIRERRNIVRTKSDDDNNSAGRIMHYLYDTEGEVHPSDLGHVLNVTTPRITNILNKLEQKGRIERQISENDRRQIKIILTEKGRHDVEFHQGIYHKQTEALLDALGEEDLLAFLRVIEAERDIELREGITWAERKKKYLAEKNKNNAE